MKKSTFSYALFLLCFIHGNAFAASFSDVQENNQFYAAIESLKNLGIVNGYNDGTFGPGNPVTRAEAVKMILISAGITTDDVSNAQSAFSDVATSAWYLPFTVKAKTLNIVSGYGNTGAFKPDKQVSKAEFIKILLQTFKKDLSKHSDMSTAVSSDTAPGEWYLPQLRYAKTIGIISPSASGKLEPNQYLTRADCAEILYKFLIVERGGETQKLLSIAESNLVNLLVALNANKVTDAMKSANDAVANTGKALEASPDKGIVKAADKIARGFQKLVLAYEAGLNKDYPQLISLVEQAKKLAGEAYIDDSSTQPLGKKIKLQADVLLQQVPQQ